jgi:dihydrofolate reductase
MTRNIVLMCSISLDGYFEGPDHDISWHLVDEELHRHMNAYIASTGVVLTGRRTHELMVQFWPTADQDPAQPAPVREFAAIWRDKPKLAYSRTLDPGPAEWNTTVLSEVDPEALGRLKEQPGGDLVLSGPDLAVTFLRLGLVDEFRLYIHPVVLGRGVRLFREADAALPLRLVATETFGNGVVMLRHRR